MYSTTKSAGNALSAPRTIMIHECFYTISLRDVGTPRRKPQLGYKQSEPKASPDLPTPNSADDGAVPSVAFSPSSSPIINTTEPPRGMPSPLHNTPSPPGADEPTTPFHPNDLNKLLQPQSTSTPTLSQLRDGSSPAAPSPRSSPSPSLSRFSSSPPPVTMAEILRDGIIDALDIAVMSLSTDGTVAVRNQQWVDLAGGGEAGVVLLSERRGRSGEHLSPNSSPSPDPDWHPSLVITNLEFTHPIEPTSHPLYRAAILGQVVNEIRCGGVRLDSVEERLGYAQHSVETSKVDLDASASPHLAPKLDLTHMDSRVSNSPTQTERSDSISSTSELTATLRAVSPARTLVSLPGESEGTGSYFPDNAKSRAAPSSESPRLESEVASKTYSGQGGVPKGVRLILEVSARPMRDARGELVGGVMTVRDVTIREKERVESVKTESDMRASFPF
jgi:hypothetical protein